MCTTRLSTRLETASREWREEPETPRGRSPSRVRVSGSAGGLRTLFFYSRTHRLPSTAPTGHPTLDTRTFCFCYNITSFKIYRMISFLDIYFILLDIEENKARKESSTEGR